MSEVSESKNRVISGVVVSDGMDKTVVVRVERQVKHPIYGKYIRRTDKVSAHDENNDCKVGDMISVVETRPLSKTKSWRLESIDKRADEADAG
ncbi:MAG: 30S ribosomal protein S17 [Pseudomonadota bacterium]|nr:30S ribosomal protein S17 [Pseudomonadota bacterium]